MGRTYNWGYNPFRDYLFRSILYDIDVSDKKFEADIYLAFASVIDYMMENKTDSQYLDFEIRKKDTYFKVVAKNSISAFWLSGIFPKDPNAVMKTNEYVIGDIKYKYNRKTKKLTQRTVK